MSMIKAVMMTFVLAMAAMLMACSDPGPAEKAGEKIDEAMSPDQGPMESMGESMDDTYEGAKEVMEGGQ